ncbi:MULTISPECIES: EcsC family protein [unclassified Sulfurimonas]|uniref:EcsC family protein n=1 Tax=unclassified Sulfurimonas TaxID=2623549 RepID=UPI0008B80BDA|nr:MULTISPECIES: EcsC family protein [unclassified Sulfurimonas]MBS4068646.1 EcsC family protein [Sulfurimonas sp.]MDD3855577.1 EcsC family protein [Sulfurimonas sp.]OHE05787.1 MAG: hypothetical protein A2345_08410 [Sulfurimonas sp. RIFOXYB12_FULL_35_9]OHE07960.1 MAG: hypothetical protein A3J96_03755 [Sulfurimonas sp. RIFOXYC2_FULL_36_7]
MSESVGNIQKVLDFAYDKAVNGVVGLDSAQELAESYMKKESSLEDNVNSLIRWQNTKAGTSGFITGLPGIMAMPVTLPANITSVLYVQIRMIAAIAYMGGHDLRDDRVKTFVYLCLAGNSAKDILKQVGVKIGEKLAKKAIEKVSGPVLVKINQTIGLKLITKNGEKGIVNLGKSVPLLGGVIGCAFDSISTNIIGNVARNMFIASNSVFESEEAVSENSYFKSEEILPDPILIAKIEALTNLMKVDGTNHSLELEYIKRLINESWLSSSLKSNLLINLASKEFTTINYDIFKENRDYALNLITDFIALSKKDGEVHIAEQHYIQQIAQKLGFSDDELKILM